MEKHTQKQLQRAMQSKEWSAVEEAFSEFLRDNFLNQTSAKKDTEFDTLWYIAFSEGGKHYVKALLSFMEEEAHNAD